MAQVPPWRFDARIGSDFAATVLFDGDRYAGTWDHGEVGGSCSNGWFRYRRENSRCQIGNPRRDSTRATGQFHAVDMVNEFVLTAEAGDFPGESAEEKQTVTRESGHDFAFFDLDAVMEEPGSK